MADETRESLLRIIDHIVAIGAKRRNECTSQSLRGMLPTETDWLDTEENDILHSAKLKVMQMDNEYNSRAAAHERVKLKRAARLAGK